MELKKIGVWSLGKIVAVISFIWGILYAILIIILQKVASGLPTEITQNLTGITELGVQNIIWIPVFQLIFGFVTGVVVAWLYNLIAKYIGGIKLEFKEEKKEAVKKK